MVYNGYYKVMSNIPKMGHLPTPGFPSDLTKGKKRNSANRRPQDEPEEFPQPTRRVLSRTGKRKRGKPR